MCKPCNKKCAKQLVGLKITSVRVIDQGAGISIPCITFDNGGEILVFKDGEGNGGGAVNYYTPDDEVYYLR